MAATQARHHSGTRTGSARNKTGIDAGGFDLLAGRLRVHSLCEEEIEQCKRQINYEDIPKGGTVHVNPGLEADLN